MTSVKWNDVVLSYIRGTIKWIFSFHCIFLCLFYLFWQWCYPFVYEICFEIAIFPFLILNGTFLFNLDSSRLHEMCPSGWIQKWIRFTYNNFNSILLIITHVSLIVRYYQHWYITSIEACYRSYTKIRCDCDHAVFLVFFLIQGNFYYQLLHESKILFIFSEFVYYIVVKTMNNSRRSCSCICIIFVTIFCI